MNYVEAKSRLENSTVLRLLNTAYPHLSMSFLSSVFRVDRAPWRTQAEMVSRLTTVLEEIIEESGEKKYPRPAKDYLDIWVAAGALATHYNEEKEIIYELTPESDQALLVFESLGERPKNTAGAESKLRAITTALREIAELANPDREARIRVREAEIVRLTEQIQLLKSGVPLEAATPDQLIERYQFAVDIARQLLADFSLIRKRFLELAKELAERHASGEANRGVILSRALDVHRELTDGPLGQSFAGFQEYLLHNESQRALFSLIEQVTKIEGIGAEEKKNRFLAKLPRNLLAEAKAVIEQTRRLSSELRHLLDAQTILTRRETKETLTQLRALIYRLSDNPPEGTMHETTRAYAEIELTEGVLRLPWRPPEMVTAIGESNPYEATDADKKAALAMMAKLPAIEIARLKGHLAQRFAAGDNAFRLQEMLEWFPPGGGNWLLEVVGYLEIARGGNTKHVVRSEREHTWIYHPPQGPRYRLPEIYFYK